MERCVPSQDHSGAMATQPKSLEAHSLRLFSRSQCFHEHPKPKEVIPNVPVAPLLLHNSDFYSRHSTPH